MLMMETLIQKVIVCISNCSVECKSWCWSIMYASRISKHRATPVDQIALAWNTVCLSSLGKPRLCNTWTISSTVTPQLVGPSESRETHQACMKLTWCPSSTANCPLWCDLFPQLNCAPYSQEKERGGGWGVLWGGLHHATSDRWLGTSQSGARRVNRADHFTHNTPLLLYFIK